MKKPINQSVNDLLNNFELSDVQLANFAQLEKDCLQPQTKSKPKQATINHSKMWLSLVASFLVMGLFMGQFLGAGASKRLTSDEQLYAIAAEVSYNHLKFKPLEVAHSNLNQVTGYFNKLDFNPLASSQVAALSTNLIGGRYCSIQGNIAAQLRMEDDQGRISTLFESRYQAQDFNMLPNIEQGQAPTVLYVDGQRVALWVEKGLVMALVSEADQ